MKTILVVFGKPGAGKSYVAHIFSETFGYYCHDGDSDLPQHMRDALFRKEQITDGMRKEFTASMIASMQKLSKKYEKLVVHQTFLKEYMRTQFQHAFPHAKFLLVETPDAIREKRYMNRTYFNLGLAYLRHMSNLFEPPTTPHTIILNSTSGSGSVIDQLASIH